MLYQSITNNRGIKTVTLEHHLLYSASMTPENKCLWPEDFIDELRSASGLPFSNRLTNDVVRLMMLELEGDGLCELERVDVPGEMGIPYVAIRSVTPKGLNQLRQIESAS